MINLLLFIVFLSCMGMVGAWLASEPGDVTLHWFDYRIDTSAAFIVLCLVVLAVVLSFAVTLVRSLIAAPGTMSKGKQLRHYKHGLRELTYSVAALAASDIKTADLHTKKAEKLLGKTPLTLLLSAQIARTHGDETKTKLLLQQMLEYEETEYLAARNLSEAASREQQFPRALALAQRAQGLSPHDAAPVREVISLHVRLGHWQEALAAINRVSGKVLLGRAEKRGLRAQVYVKQAQALLAQSQPEPALRAANAALREDPRFVPAVITSAKASQALGDKPRAIKLLLKSFKQLPHPDVEATLREMVASEPAQERSAILRKLASAHGEVNQENKSWVCKQCDAITPVWDSHCAKCGSYGVLEWK